MIVYEVNIDLRAGIYAAFTATRRVLASV